MRDRLALTVRAMERSPLQQDSGFLTFAKLASSSSQLTVFRLMASLTGSALLLETGDGEVAVVTECPLMVARVYVREIERQGGRASQNVGREGSLETPEIGVSVGGGGWASPLQASPRSEAGAT